MFQSLLANLAFSLLAVDCVSANDGGSYNESWVSSAELQKGVTEEGLMGNLKALDTIATANGGNRAFGLPGYDASVDYVLSRLNASSSSTAWTQDLPALFNQVESISFVVGDVSYYVIGLIYSPSTSEEGITAELTLGASGDVGCTNEAYAALDVEGKIVLVERGLCPDGTTLAGRMKPAAAAGAAAVVLYNNVNTTVTVGTLSNPDPENYVSTGFINRVDGLALAERLGSGESIEAYFQQTQIIEERITRNVFAETKGGDPDNVIMLGAHLDSVAAGPGINDDGSGTSLLLEIFTALQNFKTKNKVRFAWWAAEENGLIGSEFYVKSLTPTAASQIIAYLNFDMVSRGYFGVFDGDGSTFEESPGPAGSEVIEELFVGHLEGIGLNVTPAEPYGGSDYASFMEFLGTAVGGLHTGTGVEQDPCYHQACDTYDNANATVLTINAKAAAHVLSVLAMEGDELIPKHNSTSVAKRTPHQEHTHFEI